jgi:glutathione synthase/RimK-type ligase-like ATP-grasp enzyme
MKKIGMLFGM